MGVDGCCCLCDSIIIIIDNRMPGTNFPDDEEWRHKRGFSYLRNPFSRSTRYVGGLGTGECTVSWHTLHFLLPFPRVRRVASETMLLCCVLWATAEAAIRMLSFLG